MSERLIPLAAMEKIIRQVSNDVRVADGAKAALKSELEKVALDISQKAWRLATHAGRTTVKEEDIKLAVEQIRGR